MKWGMPIEKTQLFGVLKCKCDYNLCSHVAQWGTVNKKSNVTAISYYYYLYIYISKYMTLHFFFSSKKIY